MGSRAHTHPQRMCCLLQFVVRTVFGFRGLPGSSVFVPSTANVLGKAMRNDSLRTFTPEQILTNLALTCGRILIISCKFQKDKYKKAHVLLSLDSQARRTCIFIISILVYILTNRGVFFPSLSPYHCTEFLFF